MRRSLSAVQLSLLVRVWEAQLPPDVEPLEWRWRVAVDVRPERHHLWRGAGTCIYAARWLIEEVRKGLKTGLGADALGLQTAPRLFAAVALKSVVAVRVLALHEAFRLEPQHPATSAGRDGDELLILATRGRRTRLTVQDVGLAPGRSGGYLNRTRDGPPGWLTLWRGFERLHSQGFGLALWLRFSATPYSLQSLKLELGWGLLLQGITILSVRTFFWSAITANEWGPVTSCLL